MVNSLSFEEKFDFLGQCFKLINNAIELFTEIGHEEGEVQSKKIRGSFNMFKDQIQNVPNNIIRSYYSSLYEDDNSILLEVILNDEAEECSTDK